jgi:F-type H+-transporting ATPase subunit delta
MSQGVSLVAIRYARALWSAVHRQEVEKASEEELSYAQPFTKLVELFAIPQAYAVLKSPVMPRDLKENLLTLAFDKKSDKWVDIVFRNFMSNLLEANRVGLIPDIAKAYQAILVEKRKEKKARLISAYPLPSDLVNKVEKKLSDIFKKKILLTKELDPKLLGGFVVNLENYVLDYSLKSMVEASIK